MTSLVFSDLERHDEICRALCVKWDSLSAVGVGNFLSGLMVGLHSYQKLDQELKFLVAINNARVVAELTEFAREHDGGEYG